MFHPPRINCFELTWDVSVRWSRPREAGLIRITCEGQSWSAAKPVSQKGEWPMIQSLEQTYRVDVSPLPHSISAPKSFLQKPTDATILGLLAYLSACYTDLHMFLNPWGADHIQLLPTMDCFTKHLDMLLVVCLLSLQSGFHQPL